MRLVDDGGDAKGQAAAEPATSPSVLVVDDSREIRRTVAQALSDARYAGLEAEDGALALQILEPGGVDVDIVVTDIRMPRLDGVELGRRIAERKWRIPVLYMSGDSGDEIAADGAVHPAVPLLRKPFSTGTLVDMVDRVLLSRRARRAEVEARSSLA